MFLSVITTSIEPVSGVGVTGVVCSTSSGTVTFCVLVIGTSSASGASYPSGTSVVSTVYVFPTSKSSITGVFPFSSVVTVSFTVPSGFLITTVAPSIGSPVVLSLITTSIDPVSGVSVFSFITNVTVTNSLVKKEADCGFVVTNS